MRSDVKAYIDIGSGYIEFYPDNISPFKNLREKDQLFKRKSWGEITIKNQPFKIGDDIYKLYDVISELDFTFEAKTKIESPNLTVEGYFGVNDCFFDDDRKILKITPTILDNYTDILENWETKIDFSNLQYNSTPINLNIQQLGIKTIDDWQIGLTRTIINPLTGERIIIVEETPELKIGYGYYVGFGGISAFFDDQAPKRQLFTIPPTNFQDKNGFYLADREEILGENISSIDLSGDKYIWISTDTYGIADIQNSLDNIVWYRPTQIDEYKAYKSIKADNKGKRPDLNPLWWEEFNKGEIFPSKGDYELSELTLWEGTTRLISNSLRISLYCTTSYSREEVRKVDVISNTDPSGYVPPQGEGWNLRSKIKINGQNGHLWTRKPFNGSFSDNWVLQDVITNTGSQSNHFEWTKKRTTKLNYINSDNSKILTTTTNTRDFLNYVFRNTSNVFENKNVYSTFLFNDFEEELPILANKIGQNYNYVTMGQNYLIDTSFILTRNLIPDLELSDKSSFPEITLKDILDDLSKFFAGNLYWFMDDDLNLHIEHIKYLDLTRNIVDLRNREELDYTNKWNYDKSTMFNKIELRQINSGGVDFTENLILFDKIVSNKRNVDIKNQFETSIFSSDIRYAVEQPNNLEQGIVFVAFESNKKTITKPQIDEITLSSPSYLPKYKLIPETPDPPDPPGETDIPPRAIIGAGGIYRVITNNFILSDAISNFVNSYKDDYKSIGITLTSIGNKLIFSKDGTFEHVSFQEIDPVFSGNIIFVQDYEILDIETELNVKNKIGLISGVQESNGYLALSNIMNDFGLYQGVWNKGIVNGIERVFETTTRTKIGNELILKGTHDSLFFATELGIGLLNDSTIDLENENTRITLTYRYNSSPFTDRFVLAIQKEGEFIGAKNIWFDIGNFTS